MKSFKQYISEVITFKNNSSWAMSPHGFEIKDSGSTEHPDHFPHLDFMGRQTKNPTNMKKTPATSWGRVDHDNKVVHIITQNGMKTPNIERLGGRRRNLENDVYARLEAIKHLRDRFPEYKIHVGGDSWNKNDTIITHGYSEHEKHLTSMLGDN
jgi:hypothetical protein